MQFIGPEELIRNKETTGRPQDAADALALRKRKPLELAARTTLVK